MEYTFAFNEDCAGELDMGTPLPLKLGWLLWISSCNLFTTYAGNRQLYSEGIANFAVPKYVYVCA